jgi:hypothetical protein
VYEQKLTNLVKRYKERMKDTRVGEESKGRNCAHMLTTDKKRNFAAIQPAFKCGHKNSERTEFNIFT